MYKLACNFERNKILFKPKTSSSMRHCHNDIISTIPMQLHVFCSKDILDKIRKHVLDNLTPDLIKENAGKQLCQNCLCLLCQWGSNLK